MNLSNHKAIILAGGLGTRLYPVTKEIPKPLLPVKRKPIINYLIEMFQSHGVKEIAVLINKDFREEFEWWKKRYYEGQERDRKGIGISLSLKLVEEEEPLGTFGGLYLLKDWIGDSSFFLTNGDELKKIDLNKMNQFHQEMKVPATIALVGVSNPQDYGVAVCENGLIKEFIEKPKNPPSKYINSGIYLLSSKIFDYPVCRQAWQPGSKFSMIERDIFPKLAQETKLAGFKFDGQWRDCGTWSRYNDALEQWK